MDLATLVELSGSSSWHNQNFQLSFNDSFQQPSRKAFFRRQVSGVTRDPPSEAANDNSSQYQGLMVLN